MPITILLFCAKGVNLQLIISFDGNVFSGKTTLAKELARRISGAMYIQEHGDFLCNKKLPLDPWRLQKKYLHTEIIRSNQLAKRMSTQHPAEQPTFVLLDRSIVSMCAHVTTLHEQGIIDMREQFASELLRMIDQHEILIPDLFVFFPISRKTILARIRKHRLANKDGRNPAPYLLNAGYIAGITSFHERWIHKRYVPTLTISSTTRTARRVEQVIAAASAIKPQSLSIKKNRIKKAIVDALNLE